MVVLKTALKGGKSGRNAGDSPLKLAKWGSKRAIFWHNRGFKRDYCGVIENFFKAVSPLKMEKMRKCL
jgi:hypothetical protein